MAPLVLYIPYPELHPFLDVARLCSIHPDVELLTTPWEIPTEQRVARDRDPDSSEVRALEPPLTPQQADAFARAEVLVCLDAPIDLPPLAPNLRWIQAIGSGVGQFVSCRLDENVILTNAAGVAAVPIAEWVLARTLQMLKRLPRQDDAAKRHEWKPTSGRTLDGQTVAIVGLGAIGRAVAVRARTFGAHILGIRRSWVPGMTDPACDELFGPDALHEVLGRSGVVVVAATGGQDNQNMFDAAAFGAMRPGSLFLNVARGWLVDEPALGDALRSRHLAGAAIDVTRVEPLPADDPLWDVPNLLISPHSSARGEGYERRVLDLFARNLQRYVKGEALENVVDLTQGY